MTKDDDPAAPHRVIANDNAVAMTPAEADAALTRVAEAIGRHIAREHIRMCQAANDNEADEHLPRADS